LLVLVAGSGAIGAAFDAPKAATHVAATIAITTIARFMVLGMEGRMTVIGVGGFLGIGQKDVAIPFKTLKWVSHEEAAAAAASKAPGEPAAFRCEAAHPCTRCGYGSGYCPGRQAGDRCKSRLPGSCGRQHDQGRTEEGTRLPLYRTILAMNVKRTAK
jgi:hypothetical protein